MVAGPPQGPAQLGLEREALGMSFSVGGDGGGNQVEAASSATTVEAGPNI